MKVKKIPIVPAVTLSFKDTVLNLGKFLALAWFPIVLFMLFDAFIYPYLFNEITYWQSALPYGSYVPPFGKFIYNFVEFFLSVIFITAMYRFLLLDEEPKVKWLYTKVKLQIESPTPKIKWLSMKIRLQMDKTKLKIPFYFRFGKRELIYFIISFYIFFVFMIIEDMLELFYMQNAFERGIRYIEEDKYYSLYMGVLSLVKGLFYLVYAKIIFMWPYLVCGHLFPEGSSTKEDIALLLKATKGNVLRILIIGLVIYGPYRLLSHSGFYLEQFGIGDSQNKYSLYYAIEDQILLLMYYFCLMVDVVFTSSIYKNNLYLQEALLGTLGKDKKLPMSFDL